MSMSRQSGIAAVRRLSESCRLTWASLSVKNEVQNAGNPKMRMQAVKRSAWTCRTLCRHAMKGVLIGIWVWVIVFAGAHAAMAEAWIFGVGVNDFTELSTKDRAIGSIEYQTDSVTQIWGVDTSLAVAASFHASRDIWAGFGLAAFYPLQNKWFVEGSVMPGFYFHEDPSNDLGSRFEIRSLIGIGRQISDSTALSVAITHKSNAGTSDVNPGVNALLVRLRYAF